VQRGGTRIAVDADADALHEPEHARVGVDLDDPRARRQYSMPYCGSVPNGPRRVPSASTTSACAISCIAAFEPW